MYIYLNSKVSSEHVRAQLTEEVYQGVNKSF